MPLPPGASRQEGKEQLAQGTERKELSILQSPRIQVLGVVLFISGVTEIQFCSWKTHSLPSCTWVELHAELWAEFQTEVAFSFLEFTETVQHSLLLHLEAKACTCMSEGLEQRL